MSVAAEEFKQVLRRWASGITVVTSRAGDRMHGMTVSAFSSVSLDPPLVLVCANQASTTHSVIETGGVFTVNILAADQEDVSMKFASSKYEDTRFEHVEWEEGTTGAPLITGALANIECKVVSAHREGSHTIYIGQVEALRVRETAPLLYYRGAYHALVLDET